MKKRLIIALSLVITALFLLSAFVAVENSAQTTQKSTSVAAKKPFYVGVTYCGNSATEAEQLINKVKSYTNLFVIQSGPLMSDLSAMEQICDYAVNAGLNIIVYYAHNGAATNTCTQFLSVAQSRWGSHFLGLYYNDEPGGKMIDNSVNIYDNATGTAIDKGTDGYLSWMYTSNLNNITTSYDYTYYGDSVPSAVTGISNGEITAYTITHYPNGSQQNNNTNYFTNGTISSQTDFIAANGTWSSSPTLWYQPNGVVENENGTVVTNAGGISQFETYQEIWGSRPLQTSTEAENAYVDTEHTLLSNIGNQSAVPLFTSEYALDWYDYQAGYDVVLGQLGWGQPFQQDIDMVRGAADMAGKSWGTMVTWASNSPPYLLTGDQMYSAMRQSYESGAEYVVVFNYNNTGTIQGNSGNGTATACALLQNEQFSAIQRFWTDVVENQSETNNVAAKAAFVLPQDFGGALRNENDNLWGIWQANATSQQIWSNLQAALSKYGSNLDVVYDDPAYPIAGCYQNIVYWNQTA